MGFDAVACQPLPCAPRKPPEGQRASRRLDSRGRGGADPTTCGTLCRCGERPSRATATRVRGPLHGPAPTPLLRASQRSTGRALPDVGGLSLPLAYPANKSSHPPPQNRPAAATTATPGGPDFPLGFHAPCRPRPGRPQGPSWFPPAGVVEWEVFWFCSVPWIRVGWRGVQGRNDPSRGTTS